MIGLHLAFDPDDAEDAPGRADRFAAALSIGQGPAAGVLVRDAAILAAPVAGPARGPGLRRRPPAPPRTPDGALVLFDGRIDNRDEVLAALDAPPGLDDATLYGLAHAAWGDDCDRRLIGTYAAILWRPDVREARLARSPIEAPPLLIWRDRRRAVVASLANAIFACDVERRVDEQKIADTLFLNYDDAERSFFQDVLRLPAGHQARLTREGLKVRRFWSLDDVLAVRLPKDDDYVEAADDLFRRATGAALSGALRPGVSLSGGFDSQAVAAYALEALPDHVRLPCFTSAPLPGVERRDPPGRFGDERAHVEAFAAMHPRADVEVLESAGLDFEHRLDSMFLLAGAPPRNAMNLYWIHEIHARARETGCDILLTGAMGNLSLSFSGTAAYAEWFRRGRWLHLAREILRGGGSRRTRLARFRRMALRPNAPRELQRAYRRLASGRPDAPLETWCPLDPDWARRMAVEERARDLGFDPDFLPHRSSADLRAAMIGNAMHEAGDVRQAMARLHGVPMRDPTAWRPLVEFCAGLPDEQYLRDGRDRWLARRLLKGKLPPMVLDERRSGKQAADWAHRLAGRRGELVAELDRLARDPEMGVRLNLSRLRGSLEGWDGRPPPEDSPLSETLQVAVPRAIATARFIRYVEGRNDA